MKPGKPDRRHFFKNTGLGALTFYVSGTATVMSPSAAYATNADLLVLSNAEAALLASFADVLLPGASEAGVANFVDHQLDTDPQECLLMCKYFPEIKAPFAPFYHSGIAALKAILQRENVTSFDALSVEARDAIVKSLWEGTISDWTGPPPPLFYMVVRSDAVDVVYGTKAGFDTLNIPYLAHIMPPEKW